MMKEIPKAKLITPSVVSERLKINGSVARAAIRHLEEKGLIATVGEKHHAQMIYTVTLAVKTDEGQPCQNGPGAFNVGSCEKMRLATVNPHPGGHAEKRDVRLVRNCAWCCQSSEGKVKEKLMNMVMFDKATYDKMMKEIPKAKLITPSVVSERLKINGSVARAAIRHLEEKGLIATVGEKHHAQMIYTRNIGGED
eukprot:CAMPEP_0172778120 /NCGR_PEP_ID=MMETSP1074-20121228/201747_1 /TAXON_ID=2916 /ORGANISM="Ceratium fusus, Strain PA161109" /LENGTH=195 /DNA_ID=CAMNT_0013615049 /DNA_START=1 /DNA_END=589 /DNA_ORIENTATION=+